MAACKVVFPTLEPCYAGNYDKINRTFLQPWVVKMKHTPTLCANSSQTFINKEVKFLITSMKIQITIDTLRSAPVCEEFF